VQIFESLSFDSHEQVVFVSDPRSRLHAIIAIHSTSCGPSVGGCRMLPYRSERDAIDDALRLSRGMTYKAAISGLPVGGGKAVVFGDARTQKTPALLASLGRAIENLGGKYFTAEDVGMGPADMAEIHRTTSHVLGLPAEMGGSGDDADVDVFAPSALGAVLDDHTIGRLKARIVAGGANNQLATTRHGEALRAAGVLYAPDYAINAGGMIRVTGEMLGWTSDEVEKRVTGIESTLHRIFGEARNLGVPTNEVADRIARERFEPPELRHDQAKAQGF